MKRINTAAAVLWASAFVLAALVITQAGRLPVNPAYAEMGVEKGGFTLVTSSSGRGEDAAPYELLYLLDSRDEVLLVYEIEDLRQRQIVLRGGADLPVWFRNAPIVSAAGLAGGGSTSPDVVRRVDIGESDQALATEWLLTNALGGFAFGTVLGVNTRRYHGWLVAALAPPVDRVLVLHSIVDELVLPDATVELATQQFGDELAMHPSGWRSQEAFALDAPHRATWTFAAGAITVTRSLRLTRGANKVSVTYEIVGAPAGARLRLRPLVPLRDFHALDDEAASCGAYGVSDDARGVRVTRDERSVRLTTDPPDGGTWETDVQWWRDFVYSEERDRGQDWREDVFSPGVFTFELAASPASITVTAQTSAGPGHDGPEEVNPAGRTSTGDGSEDRTDRSLETAVDQFIVRRLHGDEYSTSIIAGYPWFSDWGRDAMISLPGLLLTTGRFAEARSVLTTFATHVADGLLPNCFDDRGGAPRYNTADAGLWYIHALRAYVQASGDENLGPLLDTARSIVRAYRQGTKHGIAAGADGLLIAGNGCEPLTWMDAKRGGIAFTPRDGKPVELSALWYNALHCLAELVETADARMEEAAELRERAGHTALSMQMLFWWPERACLHDVLNPGEHDWEGDARLRPNQILAVSLPFSPLPRDMQASVVDVVRDRLLTPYGLRTLDREDPGYRARYEGDLMNRDAAYHNGTVWPWLIGPYCDALLRVGDASDHARSEARAAIETLRGELERGCLGQIAEVYDGDAPHRASGCPAQAWSVAEVLRISGLD